MIGVPINSIVPVFARSRPEIVFRTVLLPAPFAPIKPQGGVQGGYAAPASQAGGYAQPAAQPVQPAAAPVVPPAEDPDDLPF